MFGRAVIATMLREFEPGYIFTPFGERGKAYIISRTNSGAIVRGAAVFGHTAVPLIGAIVLAFVYYKATRSAQPLVVVASIALIWMAAFYLWAKFSTRGHIQYDGYDQGGEA